MPRRPPFDPYPKVAPSLAAPVRAHLRCPPINGIVKRHQHWWGQLAFPLSGAMRITADGRMWTLPPFKALWIPPHVQHELEMLGRVEFLVLYVEPGALPAALEANCTLIQVSALTRVLTESLVSNSTDTYLRREGLMMQLLLEELRTAPRSPSGLPLPAERRLRTLCEAMIEDPGSPKTLADWAHCVGASKRTLTRLFQSELRTSFAAWRRELRLSRAMGMIGVGRPVGEVAAELGYSSESAFCAMVKRQLGLAPSRIRHAEAGVGRMAAGRPAR